MSKVLKKLLFFLALLEFTSLGVLSIYLYSDGGGVILAWIITSIIILALYTLHAQVKRIKINITISDLLTVSPFVLSAPLLLIQISLFCSGKHQSIEVLSNRENDYFSWGWFQFFCLFLSFCSLILGSYTVNHDSTGSLSITATSLLCLIVSCVFRTMTVSLMFTVDSLATSLIMVLMYLIMLSVHYSAGDGRFSLLFGFTNLLTPTGYGHGYGTCPTSRSLSSSSEVERVKINESGLVGRMRRLGIMSSVYTILLLVTSISVLETELYHDTTLLQTLSPVISNKPLILSLVTVLGVLSIITTCLHYLSVLRHQQSKHADISPPTSPSSPMRPENRDVEAAGDNGVTEKR